jgi:hypothetical protein
MVGSVRRGRSILTWHVRSIFCRSDVKWQSSGSTDAGHSTGAEADSALRCGAAPSEGTG